MPRSAVPSDDRAADGDADRRVVDRLLAVRAVIVDAVAEPLKRLLQMFFEEKSGVIGANRNSHDDELYYERLMTPSVTISAARRERLRSGHPWIYRADVERRERPRRATAWACRTRAAGRSASRLYSDRSQIALRMLTRGERAGGRCADSGADRRGRSRFGIARPSTRPPTGWCTAKPICCRRSSSIATATTSWCRRSRRAWIGCCRVIVQALSDLLQPRGILARNDPKTRIARGTRAEGRGRRRRGAETD